MTKKCFPNIYYSNMKEIIEIKNLVAKEYEPIARKMGCATVNTVTTLV